jgi:hypothetical protein
MSLKPLVREFESLVQFGNVPLVVPPLVRFLGPASKFGLEFDEDRHNSAGIEIQAEAS